MKKLLTMLLVGLMILGSFSATFAEEPNTSSDLSVLEETQTPKKLELLKEFNAEIHSINALRVERNQLQIQVIEKHDNLADLIIQAKEAKSKEALTAAKETREQLKAINGQINALHEQSKAAKEAYKLAMKNRDKAAGHSALQNLININASINSKLKEKIQVLNTIVNILS